MTLYLIRHAQSMPTRLQPFADWPLSPLGLQQALQLAQLLPPLGIRRVFSSPFRRTMQTARPFAERQGLAITVIDDLRERQIISAGLASDEAWRKSWEDFNFTLDGCESSLAAQARICRAIATIAQTSNDITAVFTHGNVIGLFLNALTSSAGRETAEALLNPDVVKIDCDHGAFHWDRHFRLAGLDAIATDHRHTPQEQVVATLAD